MFKKIQNLPNHLIISQLQDVRVIGLVVFGIIILLVSWSGVRIIQTNYELQQQIAEISKKNELQAIENTNLKLKNEYYDTDQYLELQSRRLFGRAARGETLVIVPEEVALAHTVEVDNQPSEIESPRPNKPFYQRNFEAWMEFFFRHSS